MIWEVMTILLKASKEPQVLAHVLVAAAAAMGVIHVQFVRLLPKRGIRSKTKT